MLGVLVLGAAVAGLCSGFLARYAGPWGAFALPAFALVGLVLNASRPAHPEAAMGAGLAVLFFWLPLIACILIGSAAGLYQRRKQRPKSE